MTHRRKMAICDDCGRRFVIMDGIVRNHGKTQCGRCILGPMEPLEIDPWCRTESVFTRYQAAPRAQHGGAQ
jgi:hypothetical protein